EQSGRPLPAPVVAELIFADVASSDRLEAVIDLGSTPPRHHLLIVRIGAALDLGTQLGRCRARVLELEHGIAADRVLDGLALALAAIAQRPRLHAGRLHDEVEAVAIEHFLPRSGRFPVLDVQACEFHQYPPGVASGVASTPVRLRYPERI